MSSLIGSNDILLTWMVIIVVCAFAIWGEQKTKVGAFIGSSIIAIFGAMILCNIHLIPVKSSVYSGIGSIVLPLSIPLLLFKCDIKRIVRESGKLFILYHIAAVGTLIGAFICGFIFSGRDGLPGVLAMSTGGYVGGTVNIVAMGQVFQMEAGYINAVAVGANLLLGFVMLILGIGGNFDFIRKHMRHPYIDEYEAGADNTKSLAEQYWKPKNITLLTIIMCLATTFVITGISWVICKMVNATNAHFVIKQLFGSIYLVMTLVTAILATAFPKYFEKLEGAEELGNIMILVWFTTLGCAATLDDVLSAGYVLVVMAVICVVNVIFAMVAGKVVNASYEEMAIASCSTIGGPTTAAALAINKGWSALIVPGVLVGLYGYIIGNYFGVMVGNFFR